MTCEGLAICVETCTTVEFKSSRTLLKDCRSLFLTSRRFQAGKDISASFLVAMADSQFSLPSQDPILIVAVEVQDVYILTDGERVSFAVHFPVYDD